MQSTIKWYNFWKRTEYKLKEAIQGLEHEKIKMSHELEALKLKLQNEESRFRMDLEKERHDQKLKQDALRSQIETDQKMSRQLLDRERTNLKETHKLKLEEAKTLAELHKSQEIAAIKLEAEAKILNMQEDFNKKLTAHESRLNKEHFDRLSEALSKLHSEGNAHTQYVKDVFFKVLENMPKNNLSLDVGVNRPALEVAKAQ